MDQNRIKLLNLHSWLMLEHSNELAKVDYSPAPEDYYIVDKIEAQTRLVRFLLHDETDFDALRADWEESEYQNEV